MTHAVIHKSGAVRAAANMPHYTAAYAQLDWEVFRSWLDYLPGGALNIAHEAVDRHVAHGRGHHEALRWLGKAGERRSYTYAELKTETDRFARLLANLGVGKGARIFAMLGRVPELYIAALGTLKAGAVFCPLYSAFGPEPVRARMAIGEAEVLITSPRDYARKVAGVRGDIPGLNHVLLTGGTTDIPADTIDLAAALADTPAEFETVLTRPDDMALLHFTSGTTGRPKGAVHVHEAVAAHNATGVIALDLHADDIYWCTADPGWVTGTSYGIIAPLTAGVTMLVDEAEFDVNRWYDTLERERVTVWYTAPTAIRLLMKAGAALPRARDLSRLRFMASVGEPLNPEAVIWSNTVFAKPFHDNWWQTETGGIMIANYAAMDVRPGSMGKPLPGVVAGILDVSETDTRPIDAPLQAGHLALRPGWPSIFRSYLNEEARYAACFRDGWYLTGDLAMRDDDGYYWFVGRADDVIKSAGHLIGPFEVESALMEHPAVAEAAVIGIPDERAGEVVKAFVTLRAGHTASAQLQKELLGYARQRLGPAIAPRQIDIADDLPRTRSGKIMRRLLKARELGLPEGDLSTLEKPA
ncbi:acetate--CoA ligase [Altererythrobacter confluentis]|uniref:acetate--CoA ligase n=1 Tax=Allopontixanthobacter confluentis TaxID=1849021 RepID=A0A6L7GDK3_9SPHN|nr:acetate--CoA ligase [Allopontixanthobacter confluentis]MXP13208.1 acetate--CoA ligase [Allopontixanthobacter confluentis]